MLDGQMMGLVGTATRLGDDRGNNGADEEVGDLLLVVSLLEPLLDRAASLVIRTLARRGIA